MRKYSLVLFLLLFNACGGTNSTSNATPLDEVNQTMSVEQNETIEITENNISEPIVTEETNLSSENNSSIIIHNDTNETIEVVENNVSEPIIVNIETNLSSENNSSILINDTNETIKVIENNTSEPIVTEETNQSSENNITINKNKLIQEPYFGEQWYLEENVTFYEENNIDANASVHFGNTYNYTGKGIKIAVIDDGLDITHPELNGTVVGTYDISTRSTNVAHASMMGHHGTAVTGIIGANDNGIGIKGIASESQIIFLKHKEGMSDSETIELFNKANEFGADIINCSWGTYDVSEAVKEVIQDLAIHGRDGKGTIIVFATGNNAQDMGNDESAIPEVIAVGSTDKDNLRAWYSNYGENLDVVAPGGFDIGITTLDEMGENGVGTLNDDYLLANDENSFIGTSASAPIVSGVIALMLEKDRNITRLEVEEALKSKSDKIGNLDYVDGFNEYYGYGKVNVGRLLE